MSSDIAEEYFFSSGIKFECRQCGFCCCGESGTIYIDSSEVQKIVTFLNLDREDFLSRYCYKYKDSYSIAEKENGDCKFFNNGCTIYKVRPNQCKTYPFWIINMKNKNKWESESKVCLGINNGKTFDKEEILTILNKSRI